MVRIGLLSASVHLAAHDCALSPYEVGERDAESVCNQ